VAASLFCSFTKSAGKLKEVFWRVPRQPVLWDAPFAIPSGRPRQHYAQKYSFPQKD
jgi:hypothetical protein